MSLHLIPSSHTILPKSSLPSPLDSLAPNSPQFPSSCYQSSFVNMYTHCFPLYGSVMYMPTGVHKKVKQAQQLAEVRQKTETTIIRELLTFTPTSCDTYTHTCTLTHTHTHSCNAGYPWVQPDMCTTITKVVAGVMDHPHVWCTCMKLSRLPHCGSGD